MMSIHSVSPEKWMSIGNAILQEVRSAEKKHPLWPNDIIHGVAIIAEESGEAVRAALNHEYSNGAMADIEKEIVQTAATCYRMLAWIRREK